MNAQQILNALNNLTIRDINEDDGYFEALIDAHTVSIRVLFFENEDPAPGNIQGPYFCANIHAHEQHRSDSRAIHMNHLSTLLEVGRALGSEPRGSTGSGWSFYFGTEASEATDTLNYLSSVFNVWRVQ